MVYSEGSCPHATMQRSSYQRSRAVPILVLVEALEPVGEPAVVDRTFRQLVRVEVKRADKYYLAPESEVPRSKLLRRRTVDARTGEILEDIDVDADSTKSYLTQHLDKHLSKQISFTNPYPTNLNNTNRWSANTPTNSR